MARIYKNQLDAYSTYHIEAESSSLISHTTRRTSLALPALGHVIAGSTGAAISNLATYPLDVIVTRLQVQHLRHPCPDSEDTTRDHYDGIIDAAQKIYQREGLAGLFAGVAPDTAKTVADSFLFFLFYNYLRTRRVTSNKARGHGPTLPALDELSVGAAAGALSKLFTTPLSNVATRAQTSRERISVKDIASHIRAEKGLLGFWSGYSASLVLTLNPSLTFFFYESLKRLLPRSRREDPGAKATFLLAALSKAMASCITYPFSLAKARVQASSTPVLSRSVGEIRSEIRSDLNAAKHSAGEAKEMGKKDLHKAADATVFSTILRIYHDEGIESLYTGVGGEVLKGFFSHGIAMLVKEQVHGRVIQLYFALQSAYNRFDPAKRAEKLQLEAKGAYERVADEAGKCAHDLGLSSQNISNRVAGPTRDAYSRAADAANKAVGSSKSSPESASPVFKRTYPQRPKQNEMTDRVDRENLKGNAEGPLGDIGSTKEMEDIRSKKGAGN